MQEKIRPYYRSQQILELLAAHAPLSARALKQIIEPPMHPRRVRETLYRLYRRGLISKRYDGIFGNAAVFYQISPQPKARQEVASRLNVPIDRLDQPGPRHAELLHWEKCANWAEQLRRRFPGAQVIRDIDPGAQKLTERLLFADRDDFDMRPDILLRIPHRHHKFVPPEDAYGWRPPEEGFVNVAFEIERTRKTAKRMYRKLSKYASGTYLDGVVYICEFEEIWNHSLTVYRSQVLKKALRIGHYGENFFLISLDEYGPNALLGSFLTAGRRYIGLEDWVSELQDTPQAFRRDHRFEPPANGG